MHFRDKRWTNKLIDRGTNKPPDFSFEQEDKQASIEDVLKYCLITTKIYNFNFCGLQSPVHKSYFLHLLVAIFVRLIIVSIKVE